jgi:flagellar hook assembly protein FlgD
MIDFQVPKSTRITIKIYDTLGREVRTLVDAFYNAGKHNAKWDGLDNFGHEVSSGVYFYYMESIDFKEVKKALLLK